MKEIIGISSVILTFLGYIPYSFNIIRGKTKPHAFSWLIWFLLTAIGFFIQIAHGAGPGSYMLGLTTIVCFLFFVAGLIRGEKNITRSDWISLIGALIALALWLIFNATFVSILLVVTADALGLIPTIRKSMIHPYQETLITYLFSAIKAILSLFALTTVSFETAFYLFYLLIANAGFVLFLSIKRRYTPDR
jgi:hypothetical protein